MPTKRVPDWVEPHIGNVPELGASVSRAVVLSSQAVGNWEFRAGQFVQLFPEPNAAVTREQIVENSEPRVSRYTLKVMRNAGFYGVRLELLDYDKAYAPDRKLPTDRFYHGHITFDRDGFVVLDNWSLKSVKRELISPLTVELVKIYIQSSTFSQQLVGDELSSLIVNRIQGLNAVPNSRLRVQFLPVIDTWTLMWAVNN